MQHGVVGRTILKVLEEKKLPISNYTLFASKKSSGKKLIFMNKEYEVQELKESSFDENFDFAIFSAGSDIAKKFAPIAASKKCIVIDNSNAFRMDLNVPLIIPEVNSEEIKKHNYIISNPNCSTIQAVVALKPLDDKYKIKRIIYSTYQAVSGAGSNGINDLENGICSFNTILSENINNINNINNTYLLKKFSYPIFNNCLPHIDVFLKNRYTKEEEKMINETRKILKNPDLKITATAVRVPVFNCHCESINIEFERNFILEELIDILKNSPSIVIMDDINNNIYPIPTVVTNKDEVFVGRIRRDESIKSGVNLWVVSDNIRKGAATNAVQILEQLL